MAYNGKMISPDEVYTTKETKDFLKVSNSTIKRFLKRRIIKAYKVGGQYRILGSEILRLISPEVETKFYRKIYKPLKDKTREIIEKW